MTRRQPSAGTVQGDTAPGHLVTAALASALVPLGAMAALIILAPLLIPAAIAVTVIWYAIGGSRWRYLIAAAAVAALIGAYLAADGLADLLGGIVSTARGQWSHRTPPAGLAWHGSIGWAARFVYGFGPIGPAVGALAGVLFTSWRSARAHGQTAHPLGAYREAVTQRRQARRAASRAGRLSGHPDALAVAIERPDVDRRRWRRGWAIVPGRLRRMGPEAQRRSAAERAEQSLRTRVRSHGLLTVLGAMCEAEFAWPGAARLLRPTLTQLSRATIIAGVPGSGKTTLIVRLAWLTGRAGMMFILVDFKGTDPELPAKAMTAWRAGYRAATGEDVTPLVWPETAVNWWSCTDPEQLVGRLLRAVPFARTGSAAFYRDGARKLLQLACHAPDPNAEPEDLDRPLPARPPRNSAELLERLDKGWLASAWRFDPVQTVRVSRLDEERVIQTADRFEALFRALGGRFDGEKPFESWPCGVFTVLGLGDPEDARVIAAMLLADVEHWAGVRKDRGGRRAVVVVDEFSSVAGEGNREIVEQVINLAERARDAGVSIVASVQSLTSFGDQLRRAWSAFTGGVLSLQSQDGELLRDLAGHEDAAEMTWRVSPDAPIDSGTMRNQRRPRLDPDRLGSAEVGQVDVILNRRESWAHVIECELPAAEHARTADMLSDLADVNAESGPIWAHARRMADYAGELAGPGREVEPSGLPELPAANTARRLVPDTWRVPPARTVLVFVGAVLARVRALRHLRVSVTTKPRKGSDEDA